VTIGAARHTALLDSEGPFFLPLREAFPDASRTAFTIAARLDPGAGQDADSWWLAFRAYVVDVGGRIVLVDTGAASDTAARSSWAPLGPHLSERLTAAALAPGDVTYVVLTHLHGDHTAGSVDAEGAPAFPNAEYLVPADDLAAVEASGGPLLPALVDPLRRSGQLRPCRGEVELVQAAGGGPVVRILPTPGHTPGHQSVLVESRTGTAILAGDVVLHAVQLADPECRYVYDHDHELAARSRRDLLARVRSTNGRLGTAHLGLPWIPASALPDDIDSRDR
jgi:glyoxylase-like metal-dependent hydrolase (beta-lactamase superfamily II)